MNTMPGEYAAGPLPRAATCSLGCDEDRDAMRLAPAACCDAVLAQQAQASCRGRPPDDRDVVLPTARQCLAAALPYLANCGGAAAARKLQCAAGSCAERAPRATSHAHGRCRCPWSMLSYEIVCADEVLSDVTQRRGAAAQEFAHFMGQVVKLPDLPVGVALAGGLAVFEVSVADNTQIVRITCLRQLTRGACRCTPGLLSARLSANVSSSVHTPMCSLAQTHS